MRHVRLLPLLALVAVPVVLVAGGCEEPEKLRHTQAVRTAQEPIINGSPDTTHPAVVWLYDQNQGAACTGTIVHVNGGTGYVLTAAHCSGMDFVAIATDINDCQGNGGPDCEAVFEVNDQIYHPNWNGDPGNGYDFSMIRFSGANGSTPFIPAASNDGLNSGSNVDIVGFGQTESGNNSIRNHKVVGIVELSAGFFFHPQTVCFGDSGGPALFNGSVVGVSSFVTDDVCMDYGASGRVQLVYNEFIAPYIGGDPVPQDCNQCVETAVNTAGGQCRPAVEACFADPACTALNDCLIDCNGNQACNDGCAQTHAAGINLFNAIFDCAYCQACTAECAEEDQCGGPTTSATTGAGPGTGATGATTGTGTGPGGTGAGGGGSDGEDEDGEDEDGEEDEDDDGNVTPTSGNGTEDEGCTVSATGSPTQDTGLWLAVAGAAMVVARRRRSR